MPIAKLYALVGLFAARRDERGPPSRGAPAAIAGHAASAYAQALMGVADEASNALVATVGSPAALDDGSLRALDDLVGDDHELVGSLVDVFLEEAPVRLAELSSGLGSGDAVLLGRAAHTLKSNALTFGALRLADLC